VTERRLGTALQTALGGLLLLRPTWAVWGFTLLVYGGFAARIIGTVVDRRQLPWSPPQVLALPACICLSTLAPPLAPALLATGLHCSVRREALDASSLVPVLLGASAVLLLDRPLPVFPGLPSDPLQLGGVLWVALGLMGRSGRDAVRVLRSRRGVGALAAGHGLPTLALLHAPAAAILFHPWAYGLVLIGWVCLLPDSDARTTPPQFQDTSGRADFQERSRPALGRS
jgi:hypothetical protein